MAKRAKVPTSVKVADLKPDKHNANRGTERGYQALENSLQQSQTNAGGMSDMYADTGTYVKSFYTVMCAPSCTKIAKMGVTNMRLHHLIQWKYAVPQIVSEEIKKAS
jgi:hypothetical protein